MSLLNQIFDGSVLSSERLMRHRQFYSPAAKQMPAQAAFARWTQRVAVTSELEAARELAGLSDAELRELEAEFIRSPMRQPARWVRQVGLPRHGADRPRGARALAAGVDQPRQTRRPERCKPSASPAFSPDCCRSAPA